MKLFSDMPTEDFTNIMFKGFHGVDKILDEFTLADLSFMNPFDWINPLNIILKDEKKYEPIVAHLKRMLIFYVHEIAKMDVEIASVLKKRPILKPEEDPKDLQKLKVGKIQKEHWSVVYNRREGQNVQKIMCFLRDKHLYSSTSLKTILEMTEAYKGKSANDLKCFSDMIKWYLVI